MAGLEGIIMKLLLFSAGLTIFLIEGETQTWPMPYQRVPQRPPLNSYCKAGAIPFCPTGRPPNTMPNMGPSDTLYVFAMKAPASEFPFGKKLEKYHIMQDAIGFHHVESGANFTMEWYALFEFLNGTFPHVLHNNTLVWCHQGAACISSGIDHQRWMVNGSLVKVATITGEIFNKFANWTEYDNDTAPFYETWTVRQKPDGQLWFNAWDGASWVLRAFEKLHELGTQFNHSVQLNYTRINIYCREPVLIGNASTIFHNKDKERLAREILSFYRLFQFSQSMPWLIEHLIEAFFEVVIEGKFFLYYNDLYWYLSVTEPFIRITYDYIPLPGSP